MGATDGPFYDQPHIKEVFKPMPRPELKDNPDVTAVLKVSIPVKFGGYTGQRDQWESHTKQMDVSLTENGDIVTLKSQGSNGTKVELPMSGLLAAIDIIKDYHR